jgi:hypothetical protein
MEILFANTRLRELCCSFAALRAHLGEQGATAAIAHLASLRAASCLDEFRFLPGRCREDQGRLTLRLPHGRRLTLEPTDEPRPTRGDGKPDWDAIQSVRIVAITASPKNDKRGTT